MIYFEYQNKEKLILINDSRSHIIDIITMHSTSIEKVIAGVFYIQLDQIHELEIYSLNQVIELWGKISIDLCYEQFP